MKKAMVISFLLVLLVVIGCQPGSLPGRGKEPVVGYKTGSQGVRVNFMPNYPRPRMFADEPFDVLLELRNMGAYPVGYTGDKIYLSGFDPTIIQGISSLGFQIPAGFEGITQFNPEGGYDTLQIQGTVSLMKMQNIDHYPATVLATACYGYKTLASGNICLDPDPFSTSSERKVCTPSAISFGTQGAPIAISSVDVEATRGSTLFKISIDNVGGGTVFDYGVDNLARCNPYHSSGLGFREVDKVRLSKVEIAGKVITTSCKPFDQTTGAINLINGHTTIFCRIDGIGSGPAYTTPLTVELDYGYRSTVSTSIDIVKTP